MNYRYTIFLILFLTSCAHSVATQNQHHATFRKGLKRSLAEAYGSNYMITTQGGAATKAGTKMFDLGGNAIDAAIAISFAISVERPQSTGLGGGGFMLIHLSEKKKTLAVDFREQAPGLAGKDMYLDKQGNVIPKLSQDGILSAGVPGIVAGLVDVHKKYGKLKLSQIIQPAIDLAETGFRVYPHLAKSIDFRKDLLAKYPASKKIFFKDGKPLKEGDWLVQKDLAKTLRRIAKLGKAGFYKGPVAKAIIQSQKKYKGLIRQSDLDQYSVKYRNPVWGSFRGYRVASMPPPSSGGIHVLQILNTLEPIVKDSYSKESIHWIASAMQRAFADRAEYLGDSDFVKVPLVGLSSKGYARSIRRQINASERAIPSKNVKPGSPWPWNQPYESDETVHFTVMDKKGNTVSSTQTVNYYMGSGVVVDGAGFLLNNEMDDFSAKPGVPNIFGALGNKNNAIQPKKRPLSSMSPTILFDDKGPKLALGSPAGTKIISCVAQVILNYIAYEKPLFDSIANIRIHHQWIPDEIRVDEPGLSSSLTDELTAMGHSVRTQNLNCRVNGIAREGGMLHGVADPRGEGLSLGN